MTTNKENTLENVRLPPLGSLINVHPTLTNVTDVHNLLSGEHWRIVEADQTRIDSSN